MMMVVSLSLSWHSSQGVPDGKVFERPIGLRQLARHIMETWIAVVSVHVRACECVDVCACVCPYTALTSMPYTGMQLLGQVISPVM